jgi:DNA-binding beta-propeller fold protein YncE
MSWSNGIAVSRDGSTLLVSDYNCGSHSISVYNVADGVRKTVFGGPGAAGPGPLQLDGPGQVCIADDGVVFVADCHNQRVQVLTPGLDACSRSLRVHWQSGTLHFPLGVCANADIVVVSEFDAHRLTVFKRSDGSVVQRMGCEGSGDGQLKQPYGVCFMSGGSQGVAVADSGNNRVSVFGVDGTFVRHVGVGVLESPIGVACSAFDELVVADIHIQLFSASGVLLRSFGDSFDIASVAIHGDTIFAQDKRGQKCMLYV